MDLRYLNISIVEVRYLKRSRSELQTVANSISPSVEHAVVHQESFGSLNGTAQQPWVALQY